MKFKYTATKDGKTIHGNTEAADRDALISALSKQGIKPLVIKTDSSHTGNKKSSRGKKVKAKDLVVFTRQLSTMISAGVPLTQAMATLQEQASSQYFKTVIGSITKDIEGGTALANALAKYPRVFSPVYINMVRAGEAGGILDKILGRLASQVEQDMRMRKKIKSAMTYPAVIFSVTIVAFIVIMLFVIPRLGAILKELGGEDAQLPIYTQLLLNFSDFMQQYFVFIFLVLGLGGWLLRRYIRTPKGRYQFHYLLLKIPLIKTIIVKAAIARFARTFASLMSAGVSVLDALEVTGGAIGNKVIERELKEAAVAVRNGKQLSQPLRSSAHFPPIVAQMLSVGEETGQIDTILVKVADFYEEDVENTVEALSSIIEPLMIVVLGGMVGFIAISVMGPIASFSQNVGTD